MADRDRPGVGAIIHVASPLPGKAEPAVLLDVSIFPGSAQYSNLDGF